MFSNAYITSSVRNLVSIDDVTVEARRGFEGDVIVADIASVGEPINSIELADGKVTDLSVGDTVVGCLGNRPAVKEVHGSVPVEGVPPKSDLSLLIESGLVGEVHSAAPEFEPTSLNLRGVAVHENEPLQAPDLYELTSTYDPESFDIPLILTCGSSMESGKSSATRAVIREFAAEERVGAAKLTGTVMRRDILGFDDAGADKVVDFSDTGVLCTVQREETLRASRSVLASLADYEVDIIVAELGGGILTFGPKYVLESELMTHVDTIIFAAADEVGAVGGVEQLRNRFGLSPSAIVGPVCDTLLSRNVVEDYVDVPAFSVVDCDSRCELQTYVRETVQ